MDERLIQLKKALGPMLATFGKLILNKPVQPLKASYPKLVQFTNVKLTKLTQFWKVFALIYPKVSAEKVFKLEQSLKARGSI